MRCFPKRLLATALTLLGLLLLLSLCLQRPKDPLVEEVKRWAQEMVLQQLQPEGNLRSFQDLWNASASRNVSYRYLAGHSTSRKKFLTVGLSSVKRKRGNYLLDTLKSIFVQSTQEELEEMVVVVHLADPDSEWNTQVVMDISARFTPHLLRGQLLVIHAPPECYPPLEGLKRNYNDAEDRVQFRSKQNVDYAYLLSFAANLSSYYLMIEDDVQCSKSFFTTIRKAVASQEGSYWVTLEFSKLGYIGKLYHSSDLPQLAQFLLLFYQEMPCDWLLGHFRLLLTQKEVIRFKPSLFQHIGLYSSFQGTLNQLKDNDFEANSLDLPDNPPAVMFTDIDTFENYLPSKAYSTMPEYFWGKSPSAGSHFTIMFRQPARISRLQVHTGSEERHTDYLHSGTVELGSQQQGKGKGCSTYTHVGAFEKGHFDRTGLENSTAATPECVRILVTESQSEWLIIRSISIWTKANS
ncbi:alpha-1,6-mannosyl-glycoprotein 4-beta-N-acetylglucosaminyltransferase-like [Gopherus flavomarginatus]|uniref:alpha-1,6-mannosyl-glycoprotein 4-beta-N-acetylglucosaminyltransferase-like n=1 Tax=Gopherus flavomarginatus TaxID=286002 RepID=UPI0021CC2021|nr:alpha-1,6-mannosyl-glycoprotein 4-beta-N-acetylglucosaminyltransferase-like [Gopherus flavomarginatus]XP_050812237.1 alpha-1,6-mannosyl-glycoprotein 4-beta-N-acetylglucosaminyltransferase-like [Gopherus flavomarginatus]XP_050812238.1 alpha-1,6-mannosyl-glycoprotein 4-beta-N-acetylglucosaminyltransferase-like [Gopherus flavomarginatus]XP_050812240.1 alpha-1,6-mannosyl-glycoprotein 4-beta-N-acetylglucosaminyltransferase-like [Gopherus flavomarginatus]XP_050812241.1 alpha-1,6-mannosyl-glycoprot